MRLRTPLYAAPLLFVLLVTACGLISHRDPTPPPTVAFPTLAIKTPIAGILPFSTRVGVLFPTAVPNRSVVPGAPTPCASYEGCYKSAAQMNLFFNDMIRFTGEFFDKAYGPTQRPKLVLVGTGKYVMSGCFDDNSLRTPVPAREDENSYGYCPADKTIYIGQQELWHYYHDIGDAAPVVGLAHEWGHHIQKLKLVPEPQTNSQSITHENQADCIAGAWTQYAAQQGWLEYPGDLKDIDGLMLQIASAEGFGRDHGTLTERRASFDKGYKGGLKACNSFYPSTPVN